MGVGREGRREGGRGGGAAEGEGEESNRDILIFAYKGRREGGREGGREGVVTLSYSPLSSPSLHFLRFIPPSILVLVIHAH